MFFPPPSKFPTSLQLNDPTRNIEPRQASFYLGKKNNLKNGQGGFSLSYPMCSQDLLPHHKVSYSCLKTFPWICPKNGGQNGSCYWGHVVTACFNVHYLRSMVNSKYQLERGFVWRYLLPYMVPWWLNQTKQQAFFDTSTFVLHGAPFLL